MLAYVEMGLQDSPDAPGWWNGYNWNVYTDNNCDSEQASAQVKNDLKNTCLYYTNRYLLISLRVEVEILTIYLKNLLLSVFINKWGGGFVLPGFCGVADRDCR